MTMTMTDQRKTKRRRDRQARTARGRCLDCSAETGGGTRCPRCAKAHRDRARINRLPIRMARHRRIRDDWLDTAAALSREAVDAGLMTLADAAGALGVDQRTLSKAMRP